jgi:hypothetical protein
LNPFAFANILISAAATHREMGIGSSEGEAVDCDRPTPASMTEAMCIPKTLPPTRNPGHPDEPPYMKQSV